MITHMPPKKKNRPQRMEHSMDRYVCACKGGNINQGGLHFTHHLSHKVSKEQALEEPSSFNYINYIHVG